MPSTHETRVLEHPVRCDECANATKHGACRFAPWKRHPGVKPLGCLYFKREERRDAERR